MEEGEAGGRVRPSLSASRERHRVDDVWMRRALGLADRGAGLVAPNPLVGCVVVARDEVVGEGWHAGPGRPHAEAVALDEAGEKARGATLFVTLEPCNHQGRTPACVPRIVQAGVRRVVVATLDPYPLVDGRGVAALRAAGIEVRTGVLEPDAVRSNAGFLKHVTTGLPHVTLKMAASLDGKAAARDGSSRWITGEVARLDVHRLRAAAGAVVAGAGTVRVDDPSLTARHPDYPGRRPLRVVVDGRGTVPAQSRVFDGAVPTLVATTSRAPEEARAAWRAAGADVVLAGDGEDARVSLERLLADLGKRDVQRVLIEGGPELGWDAVASDLVDEIVVYLAPVLVGGRDAPGVLMGQGIARIAEARRLEIVSVERLGADLKVVADVHRHR